MTVVPGLRCVGPRITFSPSLLAADASDLPDSDGDTSSSHGVKPDAA